MRQNALVDVSVHEYKPSKANHCAGGQSLPDLLKHGLWMLGPPYINPPLLINIGCRATDVMF